MLWFNSRRLCYHNVPANTRELFSRLSKRHLTTGRPQRRISICLRHTAFRAGVILGCSVCIYVVSQQRQWSASSPLRADSGSDSHGWPQGSAAIIHRGRSVNFDASSIKVDTQEPPPQTRVATDENDEESSPPEQDDVSAWDSLTSKLTGAKGTFTSVEWSSIPDMITKMIIPEWARVIPDFVAKLQNEMSMAPGTLAEEIWLEAHDPEINPEIIWDAQVRVSTELCREEKAFLENRKEKTRIALARYLDIPEREIHPDDVPVIAMCGSGGGLRALVAGTSSYMCAKQAGLFDCLTYTAGVSGSCWLQTLYYSSITGQNHEKLIKHLKSRLGVHIAFPPAALSLVNSAPTNKFLLSGLVEKLKGIPDTEFGIVDLYGLLLAARLLVPKDEIQIDDLDLKISNQRRFTDSGDHPLPIYTAVRHEIPLAEQQSTDPETAAANAKQEAWFQWFEFTPYEFWCEELEAGIPTWAVGRKFKNGRTLWRENGLALPELRVPQIMGIWGSAFCATLSHYYKEIRPFMMGVAGFSGVDNIIAERDDELIKLHPIDPAMIPNFASGMKQMLPTTVPESIFSTQNLQLMDAGMSNNLPIYPLLRPGREVDVLIAFDASADIKTDNWLRVADGYVKQRGVKGWPVGAGWPPDREPGSQVEEELEAAQAKTEQDAERKIAEAQQEQKKNPTKNLKQVAPGQLDYCNVWVGTTEERTCEDESPYSKRVEEEWELMRSDAGITVVYFPFLANPKVDGVDPKTSDFMSTWNFVYTPDQVDKVVALARANFEAGKEQTKRTVRAVYERRKKKRLEREKEEKEWRRRRKMRRGQIGKKLGQGDHSDHFS